MKLSEKSVNAVKSYFKRNWKKEDMMNSGEIPLHAHKSLKKVYLTLFCAMLSSTFGSYLHLIWEAGGLFTVLLSVACLLWLYFTSPWRVKKRVLLLMIAAFTVGASVGIFTKYLFQIDQRRFLGISYSLLCHVEFYFWIILALDRGSWGAVHSPFICSMFTLALLYITMESALLSAFWQVQQLAMELSALEPSQQGKGVPSTSVACLILMLSCTCGLSLLLT
ncbi:hypothetical protein K7X08_008130 [Anisodus acutangulus]|uniref:Uncharacterized protein n=1 Tax=Anisodus acutangulus TaxID=402998 RepID=A0A9Q1MVJ7_9SOLA|nr:hypothetical protein K7X08_008130 [Anisodus acutangulus]